MKVWDFRMVIKNSGLSSNTKLVLYVISDFMNKNCVCEGVSVVRISKYCSLTKQTIFKSIKEATEYGILKVEKYTGNDGRNRNKYIAIQGN
jgi:predicted transcriptional regulator